jgi:hypothetical protein
MTVQADLGVASILIPKTVQNGIKGCFISHPQKNSSKHKQTVQNGIRGLLHFSSPKVFIYKKIHALSKKICENIFCKEILIKK